MEPRNHQQEAILIPRLEEQKEKSVVNPGQGDLEEAGTLTMTSQRNVIQRFSREEEKG